MAGQLVQIVDEKDFPTGGATIDEIRQKGLRYRVIRVMVEDPKGRVLLQQRMPNAVLYPGRWDNSAAGHVDQGEGYRTAALRELGEEVGLYKLPLEEIDYYYESAKFKDMQLNEWNKVYKAVVKSSRIHLALQPDEVEATRWFTRDELKKLLTDSPKQLTHGLRYAIKKHYS